VTRTLWIDASAGIAGDMLLGALVDLGVSIATLQEAVDAVLPGVSLTALPVRRAGLRAARVDVTAADDGTSRTWADVGRLIADAALDPRVHDLALGVFERLARAEARVHGVQPDEVHFHEVGAHDAIADVVGTCAGVVALGAERIVLSPVALGSGSVRTAHGILPVPAPAVLELTRGWDVAPSAPDAGELATPTGLALATTLASASGALPAMRVGEIGIGAGTRDVPHRPNVTRLVLGEDQVSVEHAEPVEDTESEAGAVVLATNVDDLDPRVWPDVLARLLDAGALDAWLTPILMKKGRPAHTLHVLARLGDEAPLAELVLAHTSTLGLRRTAVARSVLDRAWAPVEVLGGTVRVKVGSRDGRILHVAPEYEDAAELARIAGVPVAQVLTLAAAAAVTAGLVPGERQPQAPAI
jgi:pyridinium-3,5-bisthiocarboxylic acid mononucleotide nickel chelatase